MLGRPLAVDARRQPKEAARHRSLHARRHTSLAAPPSARRRRRHSSRSRRTTPPPAAPAAPAAKPAPPGAGAGELSPRPASPAGDGGDRGSQSAAVEAAPSASSSPAWQSMAAKLEAAQGLIADVHSPRVRMALAALLYLAQDAATEAHDLRSQLKQLRSERDAASSSSFAAALVGDSGVGRGHASSGEMAEEAAGKALLQIGWPPIRSRLDAFAAEQAASQRRALERLEVRVSSKLDASQWRADSRRSASERETLASRIASLERKSEDEWAAFRSTGLEEMQSLSTRVENVEKSCKRLGKDAATQWKVVQGQAESLSGKLDAEMHLNKMSQLADSVTALSDRLSASHLQLRRQCNDLSRLLAGKAEGDAVDVGLSELRALITERVELLRSSVKTTLATAARDSAAKLARVKSVVSELETKLTSFRTRVQAELDRKGDGETLNAAIATRVTFGDMEARMLALQEEALAPTRLPPTLESQLRAHAREEARRLAQASLDAVNQLSKQSKAFEEETQRAFQRTRARTQQVTAEAVDACRRDVTAALRSKAEAGEVADMLTELAAKLFSLFSQLEGNEDAELFRYLVPSALEDHVERLLNEQAADSGDDSDVDDRVCPPPLLRRLASREGGEAAASERDRIPSLVLPTVEQSGSVVAVASRVADVGGDGDDEELLQLLGEERSSAAAATAAAAAAEAEAEERAVAAGQAAAERAAEAAAKREAEAAARREAEAAAKREAKKASEAAAALAAEAAEQAKAAAVKATAKAAAEALVAAEAKAAAEESKPQPIAVLSVSSPPPSPTAPLAALAAKARTRSAYQLKWAATAAAIAGASRLSASIAGDSMDGEGVSAAGDEVSFAHFADRRSSSRSRRRGSAARDADGRRVSDFLIILRAELAGLQRQRAQLTRLHTDLLAAASRQGVVTVGGDTTRCLVCDSPSPRSERPRSAVTYRRERVKPGDM